MTSEVQHNVSTYDAHIRELMIWFDQATQNEQHILENVISENNQFKDILRHTNKKMETKLNEFEKFRSTQREEMKRYHQKFQKAERVICRLREANNELKMQTAALQVDLKLANISISPTDDDEAKLVSELGDETGDSKKKLKKELGNVKNLLKLTMTDLDERKSECERLREDNKKIQKQNDENLSKERLKLTAQHEVVVKEMNEKLETSQRMLQTERKKTEESRDQVTRLISENQNFVERIKKLELAEVQSRKRLATMEEQLAEQVEEIQQKTENSHQLQLKIDEKQNTIGGMYKEIEHQRNKHNNAVKKLQSENDGLYAQLLGCEDSLVQRDQVNHELKAQLRDNEEKFNTRLHTCERDLASKNEDVAFFKQQLCLYTQNFAREREESTRLREQNENYRRLLTEKEETLMRLTAGSYPAANQ